MRMQNHTRLCAVPPAFARGDQTAKILGVLIHRQICCNFASLKRDISPNPKAHTEATQLFAQWCARWNWAFCKSNAASLCKRAIIVHLDIAGKAIVMVSNTKPQDMTTIILFQFVVIIEKKDDLAICMRDARIARLRNTSDAVRKCDYPKFVISNITQDVAG